MDNLADSVISNGYNQDLLVYPICFLYRCALEIRLKELLVSAHPNKDVSAYKHDLSKLWEAAEPPVCRHINPQLVDVDLIKFYVLQFHNIDPEGHGFRYPTAKSGAKKLPALTQVDMGQLRQVVTSIAKELGGISTAIDES